MFKSVNAFQMVVLVLILVCVVMIFMRQNNTCVMNNDEIIEGFSTLNNLGFSKPIWNKDFSGLIMGNKAQYGQTYTHKRGNKHNVRLNALRDCNSMDDCIGLEVDRSGNRTIRQVLLPQEMESNLGKLRKNIHLSDGNQKNVILKKTAFQDIIDTETNGSFSDCMSKYPYYRCKEEYNKGTL